MATSYSNAGGSGNRTTTVLVTSAGFFNNNNTTVFVNGTTTDDANWFAGGSGVTVEFWFPSAKIIDEAKFYQSGATAHGTWKWQGSQDRTTWTDIGGTFTLGGVATQTLTTLAGNTTAYVFYRLFQVSGSTSSSPYIREFEFKIDEGGTTSYVNALGSGNRTATIAVTSSGFTFTGTLASLVNGAFVAAGPEVGWDPGATAGSVLQFDLGAAYVVQQARFTQNNAIAQGDWKLQRSPDGSTWTDLSATVTLGTTTRTCFGGGESNTTAARYVRLLGLSGSRTAGSLFLLEVEFMVSATVTAVPERVEPFIWMPV